MIHESIDQRIFDSDFILSGNYVLKVDAQEARENHSELVHLLHELCKSKNCDLYLEPVYLDNNELKCKVIMPYINIEMYYYLHLSNTKELKCCRIMDKSEFYLSSIK